MNELIQKRDVRNEINQSFISFLAHHNYTQSKSDLYLGVEKRNV